MADNISDVIDSPAVGADQVEGDTNTPAGADSDNMVATLEKRLKDTQAKVSEMGNENAELRRQKEKLTDEYMAAVSKAISAKESQGMTDDQIKAQLKEDAERLRDGTEEDMVEYMYNLQREAIKIATEQSTGSVKPLQERLEQYEAKLAELSLKASPEYQQYKGVIKELQELDDFKDMGLDKLLKLAKIIPQNDASEPGDAPPGNMGASGRTAHDEGRSHKLTQEEKESIRLHFPDLTDEEIKRMEASK